MLPGYIRDESGALLRVPTQQEIQLSQLRQLVKAMYDSMSTTAKSKIDPSVLEVIKNV